MAYFRCLPRSTHRAVCVAQGWLDLIMLSRHHLPHRLDYDYAEECYRRAALCDPGYHGCWHGLANVLKRKNDIDGAIEVLRSGILHIEGAQLTPPAPWLAKRRGTAKAREAATGKADMYRMMGDMHWKRSKSLGFTDTGGVAAAEACCRAAIDNNPSDAAAWALLHRVITKKNEGMSTKDKDTGGAELALAFSAALNADAMKQTLGQHTQLVRDIAAKENLRLITASGLHLDLNHALYVVYGVNYIDLVSLGAK